MAPGRTDSAPRFDWLRVYGGHLLHAWAWDNWSLGPACGALLIAKPVYPDYHRSFFSKRCPRCERYVEQAQGKARLT